MSDLKAYPEFLRHHGGAEPPTRPEPNKPVTPDVNVKLVRNPQDTGYVRTKTARPSSMRAVPRRRAR